MTMMKSRACWVFKCFFLPGHLVWLHFLFLELISYLMIFVWFPLLMTMLLFMISLTFSTSDLSCCFVVILLHILKLSAIITIYGIQARAWAQARPWALASLQFGPGSGFWKPKPTKARPKPGLWAQARPDTSLLLGQYRLQFFVQFELSLSLLSKHGAYSSTMNTYMLSMRPCMSFIPTRILLSMLEDGKVRMGW